MLSLVIVAALGVVANLSARSSLEASLYERLQAVIDARADGLDRWIDEQRRNVVFVGQLPGFGDDARTLLDASSSPADETAARERLLKVLMKAAEGTGDAQEFLLLDLDGTVRLATQREYEGASQVGAEFFTVGRSHTTVQSVYPSTLTGQTEITVGTPVFDQDGSGQRVAVLAANLNLERVDRIVLEGTGLGATGESYLVGTNHRFVHPRMNVGGATGGVSSAGIEAGLEGQDGQGLYPDWRGVPVIGVYRWLDEHDVAIVAEMTQAEAFALADRLALVIGLVGVASAALLALGVSLVSRRITRPIRALAATATRVAGGDLGATAPVGSRDEVGQLATAFNDMTAQLRENVETLELRVDERTAELSTALAAQQAAERRYRRLVEELPLGVYTHHTSAVGTRGSSSNGWDYVSPAIESLFGYPAERWREDGFFVSTIHPDDVERALGEHEAAFLRGADRWSTSYRMTAADGRTVWVRDDSVVVKGSDGQAEFVQGFLIDVTERTLAETEIRRQKQYFESLVDISPVAVVTTDRGERITGWNPAAATLFGFAAEEAVGKAIDEVVFSDESAREEGRAVTAEALANGIAHRVASRQRRDGRKVDVEIVMVPLVVDGEHTGFYVLYHDVTELEAARRDADAANQAKSAFLAAMSHEIRTPMNAVIGMSGLLLDMPLDPEPRDYAGTIHDAGEALLTIINDILDFSKIEAGRFELELRPLVLADVVRGAADVLTPTAAKKGLGLRASVDAELPAAIVGDAGRLRQILLNLLSNAVKFTDQGEVSVAVTGRPEPTAGAPDRWTIVAEVRDTGMGIPADRVGHLFQSFTQADASIARRFGGTGLGLAISRRLAELMGGTLVAESEGIPGKGSTFRLTILADATSVPMAARPGALSAAAAASAPIGPLRILLAEDNPVNIKLATRLLERMGYGADIANDGREAIDALERADYDLVLMDVQMPGLDGLDATRAIRTRWPDRPVRIVAMTANAMEGDRETCLAAGMDDYVSKPIRPDELARALAEAVPPAGAGVPA